MILRCTQRFLSFLGKSKKDVSTLPVGEEEQLHDWHAHLFYVHRRKHLIFTHSASLFSVVAFDVLKKDMRDLEGFFKKNLARCLYYEEFKADEINRLANSVREIQLLRTSDRRVLGSINDLIKMYKFDVIDDAPVESELIEFQKGLNKTPMSMLGMKFPIERFRENILQIK